MELSLNFNATDLAGGTYQTDLHIENNDPTNPTLTVPLTLNVTSQPDIAADQDTLAYSLTYVGNRDTLDVKVWNEGHAILSIDVIDAKPNDTKAKVSGKK